MEHIVQFGITIDDSVIANRAVEIASKQLAADLRSQVFEIGGGYYRPDGREIQGLSVKTEELGKEFLLEHKEEIISRTVENLTESMKRTKVYKEAVKNLKEEKEE